MTTTIRPSHMDETLFNRLKTIFPSEDDLKAVVDKLAGERLDHADDLIHETVDTLSDKGGINLPRGFARKIFTAFASNTPTATATPAAIPGHQQLPTTIKFITDKSPDDMPVKDLIARFAGGDREPEVLSAMRGRVRCVLVDKNDLTKVEVDETVAWLASPAPKGTMQGFVRGKYAVLSIDDVVEPKIELDAIDGTELDRGYNNGQNQDWSGYDRPLRAFLYYAFRSGEFKGTVPTTNYTQILDAVDLAEKSLETLGTKRGWNTVVDAWNFARRRDEGLEARMIQAVYPTRASRSAPRVTTAPAPAPRRSIGPDWSKEENQNRLVGILYRAVQADMITVIQIVQDVAGLSLSICMPQIPGATGEQTMMATWQNLMKYGSSEEGAIDKVYNFAKGKYPQHFVGVTFA